MRTLLGAVVVALALAGCSDDPESTPPEPAEPAGTTAPPGLEEVPPGYDESPDGSLPPADDELDGAALTAVLRTRSSVRADGHCAPDQVAVTLEGLDSSLGHRYSRIVVRNSSKETCVVEGVPGIGVRGRWGSTFVPEVEHSDRSINGDPVSSASIRLAPGERAASDLEWTGDLAGAEAEPASLVVVQLASGQLPAAVPARVGTEILDIGQFTTIRLTPFVPAS
ncbi:DUF4232 domain-containing protein [Nocardioides carbamazepini]|uniref:DUF4232 domain-containing protein n=1 Tax=Nocardioides carbamazepini TaxID=2854259 RepID=UPI0021499C52|nr:DUF4232 domain-containing protein [Nocardioides carbamazepini]MCR1783833.1 DUF4232 domain-containing protein [Nocardioides carbamazepini]